MDGHDPAAIDRALSAARASYRPTLIAARTRIGFGAPTKEGKSIAHGAPLGTAELAAMRERPDWLHPAFETPEPLRLACRAAGRQGAGAREEWEGRLAASPPERRAEFLRRVAKSLPAGLEPVIQRDVDGLARAAEAMPIRQASQKAVGLLAQPLPEIIGGSADLTSNVFSRPEALPPLDLATFAGGHLSYCIREHGMDCQTLSANVRFTLLHASKQKDGCRPH